MIKIHAKRTISMLGLAILAAAGGARAQQDYVPPLSGTVLTQWQIQGEYFGSIEGGGNLGAWLVANGNDEYSVVFLPGGLVSLPNQPGGGWNQAGWNRSTFAGTGKLTGTAFAVTTASNYKAATITGDGENRVMKGTSPTGAAFTLNRVVRHSPTFRLRPKPEWGAAKLWFDSSTAQADLAKWTNKDNTVQLSRKTFLYRGIQTKDAHGAGLLHIEFQGCFNPTATGQARSNSGIYLQSHYEAQVLDSFGGHAAIDDYGAVYSVNPPSVSASLPPLSWHTYDIYFTPRTSGAAGDMAGAATMTVYANGVMTQNATPVPNVTTAGVSGNLLADAPLYLQNHGNEVVYDNIWFIPNATPASLPYSKLLEGSAVAVDPGNRLQPMPRWDAAQDLGLGRFDITGRKVGEEKAKAQVLPLFANPAARP